MSPMPAQQPKQTGSNRRVRRPKKVTPARWAAWLTLRRTFEDGAWTDRAFTAVAEQLELEGRERAFGQRLAFGTVQLAKRLDHVIAVLGKRPLTKIDPPVLHALRIGTYELLELQDDDAPSSAHAAVDQAVELVRGVVGERAVAFTNAILRRAQVDGASILAKLDATRDEDLATLLSMPEWLVTKVRAAHGDDGVAALRAQNETFPGGTAFRVNAAHPDAADALQVVTNCGVVARPAQLLTGLAVDGAVQVEGSTAPVAPLVESGLLVPQSLASQLVGQQVLESIAGIESPRVLDMCAAPGGKSTHIAAGMPTEGELVAVELHAHRANSIRELARRTNTADRITVQVADATTLDVEELGAFDVVLLDAPCSGTGVLAGRPDARWKRTPEDIAELVELQQSLLAAAARLVKPDGIVIYSTCSILRDEDEDVVLAAPAALRPAPLETNAALRHDDAASLARTWPHRHGTEGFFIAGFQRASD